MAALKTSDIQRAREFFARTQSRLMDVTKDVTEEQLRFKPAPDRWSIAQNLEHMLFIEDRVLGAVLSNLSAGASPAEDRDNDQIEAIIFEKIPDRSLKAKPPGMPEPIGDGALQHNLDRIARNYDRLMAFVETTDGLRDHVLDSPPLKFVSKGAFETMDGYQWALTVAAHDQRHTAQILEVQADANYPGAKHETAAVA